MKNSRISAIAAIGKNRELGNKNELLWPIADDLRRFRELTSNHMVVMGKRTYESIGKPLPNRRNVIIAQEIDFHPEGCEVVHSIEGALELIADETDEVFIIGGGEIYKQMLPHTNRLYLTLIDGEKEADVFFPDYSEFGKEIEREDRADGDLHYSWVTLERP